MRADRLDDVEFSEKAIELGNGVRVNGRIDLVRRIATGDTTIGGLESTRPAQAALQRGSGKGERVRGGVGSPQPAKIVLGGGAPPR